MTAKQILYQLTPTTTEAMNAAYWIAVVLGTAAAFGLLALVLNRIENRIQRGLADLEPGIDDVTERRRVKAAAFSAKYTEFETRRRKHLDAAAGRRA